MAQSDDEIKTISEFSVSRNFKKTEITKPQTPAPVMTQSESSSKSEVTSRREFFKSLLPLSSKAWVEFSREINLHKKSD